MPGSDTDSDRGSPPRWTAWATRFIARHWTTALKVRDRLRMSEETFHLLLAGLVGVIGGSTQIIYTLLNQGLQVLFLGSGGDILVLARTMPAWLRVLVPAMGGLGAGWVLRVGATFVRQRGLNNLLEVVVAGDGRLQLRPALVNGLSSLVSLSSGASIGREGLIIQLSSTLASRLGQWAGWPPYRLRLLVACGAASGLSAGCHAPIAGAVFAAQIVLGNFAMNQFAPVVVSSVVATTVSRMFLNTGQWYVAPPFQSGSLLDLPWFVLLGIASGGLGAAFLGSLRWSETLFGRMPLPIYARLGLGGAIVGLLAIAWPEVLGNGYAATNEILGFTEAPKVFGLVLGIFMAKWLATAVTVGSGAVGGVFTPTLFMGAALGSLLGASLHIAHLALQVPVGVFAVVGMGSVLAATTHSPLLAMIMAFELSLNYSLMPPLMAACVISALVGRRFWRESIYTEPLRRRGIDMPTETGRSAGGASVQRIGDFMRDPVPPVRENTSFKEMAEQFLRGSNNFLPVVDAEGILVGLVALQDLKAHLQGGAEYLGVIAGDVMRPPPACVTPDQRLSEALPVLVSSELRNVPVVDSLQHRKLIGRVVRVEVIDAMAEMLTSVHIR
ncbi:MAG: chloride channel protein [Verrucomicrobia bacterium]|nr:chloride channel protein [Verrucomicrobiota bacterium]MBI3867329.1 chloride channel protein [Verrucomicrobiota bacterium]